MAGLFPRGVRATWAGRAPAGARSSGRSTHRRRGGRRVSNPSMRIDLAWGAAGARSLAAACDVVVVVDVLSFTTCISVATAHGATVLPADPDQPLPALSP